MKTYLHNDGKVDHWPTEWEHRNKRACPHDLTFHVRLGYDGELYYTCAQCRRYTVISEKTLKRMLQRRLRKQQDAEQEQGAG